MTTWQRNPVVVRFNPPTVAAGIAVLLAGVLGMSAALQVERDRREAVSVPVVQVCEEGGPAQAQLVETGACEAARGRVP